MIIQKIEIEKFRSFQNVSFELGRRITAIAGRNATQKTTVLGMIGQPFAISSGHALYGCKTIDGYNFRSQFGEKFKISREHDIIGEHKWKLHFHRGVYDKPYFAVESISRTQAGRPTTLRFWNAESRSRGAGYVQLPVYYLSLSRLFPIGESGKTTPVQLGLTPEELAYCIRNYKQILSIHSNDTTAAVGIEKGSSRTFSGVSDSIHDVFTNSAGESNIMRIILAVLSFCRLKEQHPTEYKGGILLIDELDATLYGFSQRKLVEYLLKAAEDYRIQIVFTTHSPIILKAVYKALREDVKRKGITCPAYAYDSAIVYLDTQYSEEGVRIISPRNITSSNDLATVLNDINLSVTSNNVKTNIYCEDRRAIEFLRFLLSDRLDTGIDNYMNFIDINLGWTNYVQLYTKMVPEFRNNLIVLDGDVPNKEGYESKRKTIENADNIVFLPLEIERDIFSLLKDHAAFNRFLSSYSPVRNFSYDICFNNWPLAITDYTTEDFKAWYHAAEVALGNQVILFRFWCDENRIICDTFVNRFVTAFNILADRNETDVIPTVSNDVADK